MPDRKSSDDVEQLLKDKHLGDLQYREFTPSTAAHLTLASARGDAPEVTLPVTSAVPLKPAPAATLPAQPAAVRPEPAANLPAKPVAPAEAKPTASRATVHESPLNFTFERLRRQLIPARSKGPLITLQLAPRHRAAAAPRIERLQTRTLQDVFNTLGQTSAARRHGA